MIRWLQQSWLILALALWATSAHAASETAPRPADCSKAKHPERCEIMQKAAAACKGLAGDERRTCMRQQMSQRDCSGAKNPARCEARKQAREACKDQTGNAFRECIRQHLPQPDCSEARNPEQCQARRKAKQACDGKTGQQLRECMADQLRSMPAAGK